MESCADGDALPSRLDPGWGDFGDLGAPKQENAIGAGSFRVEPSRGAPTLEESLCVRKRARAAVAADGLSTVHARRM